MAYFVHTIKTYREMTKTLKKTKIAKNEKGFFVGMHAILQSEKNLFCIFVLI